MREVPLGEVATASGSKAGDRIDLPVYSVTKHAGFVPSAEYFNKQVFSRDLSGYKFVQAGEFAYATIHLDEGSIGIAPVDSLISPMYTVFATDESRVDSRYLARYLKSPRAIAEYPMLGTGSAERRKSIPFARLKGMNIPLPSIEEQRRITAILDNADAIRSKRREALSRVDELTQSIFVNTFGDAQTIHTRWPKAALKDILLGIESGWSPTCHARPATDDEYGVLKLGAVTYGVFNPGQNKALPEDVEPDVRHEVKVGDLLFTRKNTANLVGAAALVRKTRTKLLMPDLVFRLRIDPRSAITATYLQAVLMYPPIRRTIQGLAGGSAGSMPNISKAKLLTVEVPRPAIEQQLSYERRIDEIDRLKSGHRTALAELDALFASLQSRAFRGEL
ncbi:restriction endonuclease subunit S [Nocardia sp. NPDC058633]|uniref:restriction endonuclease subunit S n=1 Tax=Nocardia sp. NPDC058633 TaxID=3346568 RepID=UPI00364B3B34